MTMTLLFDLLRAGVLVTALDIDNALYMTAVVDNVPEPRQNRVVLFALLAEFVGRLGLIALILWVFGGRQVTIALFGFEVSVESIALIAAGLFLFLRSSRELIRFFSGVETEDEVDMSVVNERNILKLIAEMTLVNLTLSVDTVLAITGSTNEAWLIIYLLLFSAIIRLLFVRQITTIINRLPSLNIIILTFLILVGLELCLQGFGLQVPEEQFNLIMLAAVLTAVFYERRFQGLKKLFSKLRP